MTTAPPSARRVGPRSIQSVTSSTHDKSLLTSRPNQPKPVSLSKRLLFPTLPADADLPPLLVSPAATPELNAELYDFIALALRAYVNPWWTKITRYDKEFLPEITRVLTAVFRALESRLIATDLSPLVFRDLPTLLNQHWTDYRNAQAKLHTSYAAGGAATLPQLFHQAQPHMAVSAEGVVDIVYVRQAVDHIMKACMPPENYEPETERYIVREVILKVLVGSVLPRVTQPWFIHKIILDLMGPEKAPEKAAEPTASEDGLSPSERPPLQRRSSQHLSFQTFAIFVLSTVQSVSGVCLSILHAYRQARETIRKVNQSKDAHAHGEDAITTADTEQTGQAATSKPEGTDAAPAAAPPPSLPGSLSVPQKNPTVTPPTPPSPSSDSASFMSPPSQTSGDPAASGLLPSMSASPSSTPATQPAPNTPPPPAIPNYTHPPLAFLLTLLTPPLPPPTPTSTRLPHPPPPPISLSSSSSSSSSSTSPLSPHPAGPAAAPATASHTTARALAHLLTLLASLAAPFLARLLPYLLYAHALSAPALAASVRAARRALFPEGWPAPPPVDPTPEEQAALRATLCARLGAAVPGPLAPLVLGPTPDARAATVDAALAPLDSQACNAHLVVFILDLVLLTVFPEMGVSEEGA
ncbi:PXA domain-containing protein [Trametes maxima]|nr:PXA domain-containing protein [Trametes maxima]